MDNTQSDRQLDRNRGILTKADREYLAGERDLTGQSERSARLRIRNRLEDGLLDLSFLSSYLRSEDREQVANSLFSRDSRSDIYFVKMFSLLIRMIADAEDNLDRTVEQLEETIDRALRGILSENYGDEYLIRLEVKIKPDLRQPNVDDLLEKYRNNEETYEEFRYLQRLGELESIETETSQYNHVLRHMWEQKDPIHIRTFEGSVATIDPTEFDSRDEFEQAMSEAFGAPKRD